MISFVYFDIGGVVIRDFSGNNKWAEMKRDLGITPDKEGAFQVLWKAHEREINVTKDVDTLIPLLKEHLQIEVSKTYSLLSDFVDRFETNPSIWPITELTHQQVQIGLLTNMYPRMFPLIKERNLLPPVAWDIVVDSTQVGCQKPEREIFEIAQKKANVQGEEILFVDNSLENVEAAKLYGWQTFLYDSAHPVDASQKLSELWTSGLK